MSCETVESNGIQEQIEKRQGKIAELDSAQSEVLLAYNLQCKYMGIQPNFQFLMENFGIGAGEAYSDEEIDAMIVRDESEKANHELPSEV
jgi:hypothetical protein